MIKLPIVLVTSRKIYFLISKLEALHITFTQPKKSIDNKEKDFLGSRLFINENLPPINSAIASMYRELGRAGFLQNSYTASGTVHTSGDSAGY